MDEFISKVALIIVLISSLVLFSVIMNYILKIKKNNTELTTASVAHNLYDLVKDNKDISPTPVRQYVSLSDFNAFTGYLKGFLNSIFTIAEITTFVLCIMVSVLLIFSIYKYYGTKTTSIFDSHSIANNSFIGDSDFGKYAF